MLMILIALIALAVLAVVMIFMADDQNSGFAAFVGLICTLGAGIGLIAYAFTGWSYLAAEYKADIINREYGTNYTQGEVYWAADVIDAVRELDRKRIEMNGDLITGERVERNKEKGND